MISECDNEGGCGHDAEDQGEEKGLELANSTVVLGASIGKRLLHTITH